MADFNDPKADVPTAQDPLEYLQGQMAQGGGEENAPLNVAEAAQERTAPEAKPEPQASEKPTQKPAEKPAEEPSGDLDKARAAIERKYKALAPTLLKTMSDEQILAMSVQIAADLKNYNDLANERDRLTTAQSTDRHEEEEPEQGGDETEPARPSAFSEILGSLDEDLYEGLPETLTDAFSAMSEQIRADVRAELKGTDEKINSAKTDLVDADVRREMAERFPNLRDPEVATALQETMRMLEPGMTYPESMDLRDRRAKLVEHALVIVNPDSIMESQGKTSQKARGGPRPPKTRGKAAPVPKDPVAARTKYLQLRGQGYSVERAKADSGLLAE